MPGHAFVSRTGHDARRQPADRVRVRHHRSVWRLPVLVLGCLLLAAVSAGCVEERRAGNAGPVVLASPSALLNPPLNAPQDTQVLAIVIENGRFDTDRYTVQRGSVRLKVITRGGPYTLVVDPVLPAQELPANSTTEIGVLFNDIGEYTMKLRDRSQAQAILNVRPPGGQ